MLVLCLVACGPTSRGGGGGGSGGSGDSPDADNGGGSGGSGGSGSYTVYAHSDHVLYSIDVTAKTLSTVGAFKAPQVMVGTKMVEDVITDLAVAPSGTIYTVSETALYTADPTDGHVTRVGSLSACGTRTVALTATPGGDIWAGDYMGALCQIDITANPPVVKAPIKMGSNMALSGDMVAVDNGTIFGTAYNLSDPSGMGTQMNNVLVKIDLATGAVTQVGPSGFPKLFGTAFQDGKVFGFTHDGTGRVVTIDTTTGAGSMFGTFQDPSTNMGISFAGAGVSSLVIE